MKYYVTADVHGFYSEMRAALEKAGFFSEHEPHKLIILGDLFDRGQEAVKMQAFVSQLMAEDRVILVRGNHEDLYMDLVLQDEGRPLRHHMSNGTYDTVLQLTGYTKQEAAAKPKEFAQAGRETLLYSEIIPAMADYFETEHYVFVHGWVPCCKNRDGTYSYYENWREAGRYAWDEARWINGMDAISTCMEKKTIVCGHWHTSYGHSKYDGNGPEFGAGADFSPYIAPGIIALDGCTAYSGMVNVIQIED